MLAGAAGADVEEVDGAVAEELSLADVDAALPVVVVFADDAVLEDDDAPEECAPDVPEDWLLVDWVVVPLVAAGSDAEDEASGSDASALDDAASVEDALEELASADDVSVEAGAAVGSALSLAVVEGVSSLAVAPSALALFPSSEAALLSAVAASLLTLSPELSASLAGDVWE